MSALTSLPTPMRIALRELRGGLKGFRVFIACLALGVAAIAAVGTVSQALVDGIAREGQAILGGDMSFSLTQRAASPDERAYLERFGQVSEVATLRAMVRGATADDAVLAEIKAVDDAYPLYGAADLQGAGDLADALQPSGSTFGLAAEQALLDRLSASVGDRLEIGAARFEVRAVIDREPDRLSSGLIFGPRVLISTAALDATGLLRPGSLVTWHYRLKLPQAERGDARVAAIRAAAVRDFPDAGWLIRDRNYASPRLQAGIERFTQILTLVGLTALVIGGVGVANGVRAYLAEKRDVIATLKCLGAARRDIFAIYTVQIGILAALGIAIGLALGYAAPWAAAQALGNILPVDLSPGLAGTPLLLALAYGVLVALAFSLWPLGRASEVPAAALFRDMIAPARKRPPALLAAAVLVTVAALAGLAVASAQETRIAVIYVIATFFAFVALALIARGIMALARRAPQLSSPEARLAIGNIHRPGALTPSIVLSLGLGLTLLVTLTLVDGNLTRQLTRAIPEQAPSFFFLDIQRSEANDFYRRVGEVAPQGTLASVPMLRGRIVALDGARVDMDNVSPHVRWVLSGDRGITYSEAIPEGAVLEAGEWWPADYSGPPLVSFDANIAAELGLKLGDSVGVNVLGRTIEAKIANLRTIEWETLSINFVMVFSPNTFAGAPHMVLATLTLPEDDSAAREARVMRMVGEAFPQATMVRVKDALNSANAVFEQIMWAIRAASSVTLIASILVLGGALAAGHHHRIRDAVILKTVGATRRRLLTALGLEFLLLGAATAIFGVLAGSAAAYVVLTEVMSTPFTFLPLPVAGTATIALAITLALGLIGTWRVLSIRPWRILRAE